MKNQKFILPLIVISQFCGTSIWFAGNGVMKDLIISFELAPTALGHTTSAVQFGFLLGTLLYALFTLVDRFSPSKVFFVSAFLAALFNLGIIWEGNTFQSILALRFFTGFFLAGIYPVGMKIAADYFENGLGKSLGYLVGALVLGTSFPHLLQEMDGLLSWQQVLLTTSTLAMFGGILILTVVPDGPLRKPCQQINLFAFFKVFRNPSFRAAASGYFGHMWELYTFWAFLPVMLISYNRVHEFNELNVALLSFASIAIGGIACVIGAYLAQHFGTKRIASLALLLSCICCLLSPLLFLISSAPVFITFLLFWGSVVIMDSPLFSTLVAQNAAQEIRGTALTIVNCIGFAITILSIQLINWMWILTQSNTIYILLALGPILGLFALRENKPNLVHT